MSHSPFLRRKSRRPPQRGESLEIRNLLSAANWPELLNPVADAEPNETLDAAQDLWMLENGSGIEIVGAIGSGAVSASDVDWFRFRFDEAGDVRLNALPNADGANSSIVLTLYGDQIAGYDLTLPLSHHLLGRSEGLSDGAAGLITPPLEVG